MSKSLQLVSLISKEFDKNWTDELKGYNLYHVFKSVYSVNSDIATLNKIVCYIVYAYDPDSLWLDLKKDRRDNLENILLNLELGINDKIIHKIMTNQQDEVGISIFNFLDNLRTWKWRSIFDLLDFSSRLSRIANKEVKEEMEYEKETKDGKKETFSEEYDINAILKANVTKGQLLDQSIEYRKKADILIEEIRKEFVSTDSATQSDFNFNFTDTSKQRNILSWREFILTRNEKNKLATS